jgi:uncharacterized protein (TIGR03067 family)
MRYVVLLSVFVIGSARAAEVVKTDSDKMQGVWLIKKVSINGEKMDVPESLTAVIKQNSFVVQLEGIACEEKCDFELDSAAKLRTMDFVAGKGKTVGLAIYKLEGDTLTICMGDKKRPEKFLSEKGSGVRLSVFERNAK